MDRMNSYESIVQKVIQDYYDLYKTMEDAETFLLTEPTNQHYQVIQTGWDRHQRRIYTTLHLSIQNEKIYIHSDPTEEGIANILISQGIPSSHIVLEYQSPNLRTHTPFATV